MKSRTRSKLAGLCCALAAACGTTTAFAANEVSVFIHYAGDASTTETTMAFDANASISLSITPRVSDGAAIDRIRITTIGPGDSVLDDVGLITLSGSRSSSETLDVILAADGVTSIPEDPRAPLGAGARHWAGITALLTSAGNNNLRDSIRLTASVAGNITGTGGKIEVGVVHTLQSGSVDSPSTNSGNIQVPITVNQAALGVIGEPSTRSVEFISAATSIAGNIIVAYPGTSIADIISIRCGPSASAVGISGTIYTPTGKIDEIRSSGPINITPSQGFQYGIEAKGGIRRIYCGVPSAALGGAPDPVFPRNINTSVRCGGSGVVTDVLSLVETAGDLKQPVLAKTIGYEPFPESNSERRGIFVGGTIEQLIEATDSVYLASIVGSTFGPGAKITIGCHLKGRIEATDPEAGVIRSVSIGRGAAGGSHDYAMNGWSELDGDPESVIRARAIESIDIAWMQRNSKVNRPRILADWIDSLNVDRMTHGEIAGYAGPPAAQATPTRANYARINHASFGRVNQGTTNGTDQGLPTSRIWCSQFEQFVIQEGSAGLLQFIEIPENRALQIGDGTRGLLDDGGSTDVYRPGLITIDAARLAAPEAPGLHGCIVINANNAPDPDPGIFCAGNIRVYHSSQDYYEFNGTDALPQFKLPDYGQTSPALGGGAIGLVPFTLQWRDCDQVGTQAQPARYLDSEFDRFLTDANYPDGAKLRFYGPVARQVPTNFPPLRVYMLLSGNEVPVDNNVAFDFGQITDPKSTRQITLHSTQEAPLMPGSYLVKIDEQSIVCDELLVSEKEVVREFEPYYFDILEDCNRNHRADHVPWGGFTLAEIDETQTIGGVTYRINDYDNNGRLDVCQFVVDQYCAADFNLDGGIDQADVELFYILWEWNIPRADINQDGGVDGGDVEAFSTIWEAGAC